MLSESYRALEQLRLPNGLFVASPSDTYNYVWIRDSVYCALPFLHRKCDTYRQVYHRLLDLFIDYEWKINIILRQRPQYEWEYLHARYSPQEVAEIHDQPWGHAQHDMIGAFLFGIGEGMRAGHLLLRNAQDVRIVQKLIDYLAAIRYWEDPDNGMWEEGREVHASSVGACVAGLQAVSEIGSVPQELLERGLVALSQLFPRESAGKAADLAQLSLVYPYRIYTGLWGERIVAQVEERLLRARGVIRYAGDSYYSTLEAEHGRGAAPAFYEGTEAEWTFGLPWLALCHWTLGNKAKLAEYVARTEAVMSAPGELPELYYAQSERYNDNTPLGWSCAMYILAKEAVQAEAGGQQTVTACVGGCN